VTKGKTGRVDLGTGLDIRLEAERTSGSLRLGLSLGIANQQTAACACSLTVAVLWGTVAQYVCLFKWLVESAYAT